MCGLVLLAATVGLVALAVRRIRSKKRFFYQCPCCHEHQQQMQRHRQQQHYDRQETSSPLPRRPDTKLSEEDEKALVAHYNQDVPPPYYSREG